tara:strand:+ start:48 stop:635 length:588 start_codon:yes stop_codon:yes gene_type:complete
MENSHLTYNYIKFNSPLNEFEELSHLHKEILNNSIVSNMNKNDLVEFYKLSLKNKLLKVVVVKDKSNIIGSISYSYNNIRSIIFKLDFLKILSLLSKSILKQPIDSMFKLFYRFKTYAFVNSGTNIPFLFISDKYRNKNIGTNLLIMVKSEMTDTLSVDTSTSNNIAINFYLSNEFQIKRRNNNITLFTFQHTDN